MIDSCPALCVFDQVNSNTPDSVFEMLEYLKELLLFLYQNYILPALAYISDLLQRAWTNLQESCNGEVSVSCLQGHALSFTNSTWQLLQHTTSAIKTWAQELLRRAWSQMLTNLHTHEVTHTYIYTLTLTQPEAAFQCTDSPLKSWLDTGVRRTNSHSKGPFYLLFWQNF